MSVGSISVSDVFIGENSLPADWGWVPGVKMEFWVIFVISKSFGKQ